MDMPTVRPDRGGDFNEATVRLGELGAVGEAAVLGGTPAGNGRVVDGGTTVAGTNWQRYCLMSLGCNSHEQ